METMGSFAAWKQRRERLLLPCRVDMRWEVRSEVSGYVNFGALSHCIHTTALDVRHVLGVEIAIRLLGLYHGPSPGEGTLTAKFQ